MTAVLPTTAVMIMEVKATSQKRLRDQDISLLVGGVGQVTRDPISLREKVVKNFSLFEIRSKSNWKGKPLLY